MQLGGGIRTLDTIETWLAKGVARVILGTVAVRDPALVREACRRFPGRVAVGIDARAGKVAVEGWAQASELDATELARRFEGAGVAAVIYTDIDRDGVLTGLNLPATAALARAIAIPVIASGGLAGLADIKALMQPEYSHDRGRHRRPRALRWPARCQGGAVADRRARSFLIDARSLRSWSVNLALGRYVAVEEHVIRSEAFLLWHGQAAECPLPHACWVATLTVAQLLPPTECPGKGVLLSSILRRANMKRIVVAAVAVCLAAAPAFAASPKVDAAIKVFKAVSADPAKLKTFCDMSKVMDAMGEKQDAAAEAKIQGFMKQLGTEFETAWNVGNDVNENSADGKACNAAHRRPVGQVFLSHVYARCWSAARRSRFRAAAAARQPASQMGGHHR